MLFFQDQSAHHKFSKYIFLASKQVTHYISSHNSKGHLMLEPFIWLLFQVIDIYFYILLANVIISWLGAFNIINYNSPAVRQINRILYQLTEPVLGPIRRILPNLGGLDFSPVVVLLGLQFLKKLILAAVYGAPVGL
jgi:YggT family protein